MGIHLEKTQLNSSTVQNIRTTDKVPSFLKQLSYETFILVSSTIKKITTIGHNFMATYIIF